MKYYLSYPTPLNEVDIYNEIIDVCLRLEDEREFTLVVTTPEGLKKLMERSGKTFIEPGAPFAIVDVLTDENIRKLVDAFLSEDETWLRIYGSDIV